MIKFKTFYPQHNMLLPFEISLDKNSNDKNVMLLAGDLGATKTSLALFSKKGDQLTLVKENQFRSKDYNSFRQVAEEFLRGLPLPKSACIGVAGPVMNNKVKITNLPWELDCHELASEFEFRKVQFINDLEATAYGLAMLDAKDVAVVHRGNASPVGNAAVIAPGTGLGEAGLYWDGNYYHPFATEGGHCDFAPHTLFDFELYVFLEKQFGHVSWERLVCGPGIVNIYNFLRVEKKREEPGWLKEEMEKSDLAAVICSHAEQIEICHEAMQHFVRYLSYESANLVLKLKATGGIFIAGGIAPQIVSLLGNTTFYTTYCQPGRMKYLLEEVPVKIVLNPKTALLGAAFYGAK